MGKTFNPCDECDYSFSKQNQESGMCKICEFEMALRDVKTLSGMYERLNSQEVSEYHRLKEYEDLEEQGKLLKLPCAVGDTVYVKMQSGEYAEAEVRDFIHFLTCGFCIVVTSEKFNKQNIPFSEFGKSVFLTSKEAEVALKELQEAAAVKEEIE